MHVNLCVCIQVAALSRDELVSYLQQKGSKKEEGYRSLHKTEAILAKWLHHHFGHRAEIHNEVSIRSPLSSGVMKVDFVLELGIRVAIELSRRVPAAAPLN